MAVGATADNAPMRSGYRVREGDPRLERDLALEVWRDCGGDFSADFVDGAPRYDWFYERNPAGRGAIFFLEHEGSSRPVGVVGLGPRDFQCGATRLRGGMLVDFAVHPSHRVFFPALLTQRAALDAGLARFDVIIGHPNVGASLVMRRLGGYREFSQLRHARVVDFAAHLGRRFPKLMARSVGWLLDIADRNLVPRWSRRIGPTALTWTRQFDDRYDRLWEASVAARGDAACAVGVRDAAFLDWRFAQQPGRSYHVLEFRRGRASALDGYFVCQTDGDSLVVSDVVLPHEVPDRTAALHGLVDAARLCELRSISIDLLADAALRRGLAQAGFRERESHPALVAAGARAAPTTSALDWYLTMADANV